MYGIKSVHDVEGEDGDEVEDIEAAIQKEVAALNSKRTGADGAPNSLTPIKMNVDCLLFVKTEPPIDPVAFVRRICEDAKTCNESGQMRCRYLNRLTPVTMSGKATEQGLIELAKEALSPFFDLSGKRTGAEAAGEIAPAESGAEGDGGKDALGKAAEEKAEGTEAAGTERKPFTVSIGAVCSIQSSILTLVIVCHPAEHPQPRQAEERRRDQLNRRSCQRRPSQGQPDVARQGDTG
jgi:tRNA acetyltransferase TAN1